MQQPFLSLKNSDQLQDQNQSENLAQATPAHHQYLNSLYKTFTVAPEIARLFFPYFMVAIASPINNFVASSVLSNYEPTETFGSASAIIFPAQVGYLVIPSAFLIPICVYISIFGRKDNELDHAVVNEYIVKGIVLAMLVSFPAVALSYFTGSLYRLLGTSSDVVDVVNDYFSIFFGAIPIQLMASAMQQAAMGMKEQKEAILYLTSVINMAVTIGSLFFLPRNAKNVAWSFILGGSACIATYGTNFMLTNFQQSSLCKALQTFSKNKKQPLLANEEGVAQQNIPKPMRDMSTMGLSILVQLLSELGAVNALPFFAKLLLSNSDEALQLMNVANAYNLFCVVPPIALGQTLATIIGGLVRSEKYEDIANYGDCALLLSTAYNSLFLLASLCAPIQLGELFGCNDENLRILLPIVFTGLLFNSYRDIILFSLRPLNVVQAPAYISLGSLWGVGMPLAVAAAYADLGVIGMMASYYIGTTVGSIALLAVWFSKNNPENDVALKDNAKTDTFSGCVQTVFRCCAKSEPVLVNEYQAVAEDNEQSVIDDRDIAP